MKLTYEQVETLLAQLSKGDNVDIYPSEEKEIQPIHIMSINDDTGFGFSIDPNGNRR
jgi:hypothetical protein